MMESLLVFVVLALTRAIVRITDAYARRLDARAQAELLHARTSRVTGKDQA